MCTPLESHLPHQQAPAHPQTQWLNRWRAQSRRTKTKTLRACWQRLLHYPRFESVSPGYMSADLEGGGWCWRRGRVAGPGGVRYIRANCRSWCHFWLVAAASCLPVCCYPGYGCSQGASQPASKSYSFGEQRILCTLHGEIGKTKDLWSLYVLNSK